MKKSKETIKILKQLKEETGYIGKAFSLKKRKVQNKAIDEAIASLETTRIIDSFVKVFDDIF